MIAGKEDAANNFARFEHINFYTVKLVFCSLVLLFRGHYTVGKEILEDVLEEVKCEM